MFLCQKFTCDVKEKEDGGLDDDENSPSMSQPSSQLSQVSQVSQVSQSSQSLALSSSESSESSDDEDDVEDDESADDVQDAQSGDDVQDDLDDAENDEQFVRDDDRLSSPDDPFRSTQQSLRDEEGFADDEETGAGNDDDENFGEEFAQQLGTQPSSREQSLSNRRCSQRVIEAERDRQVGWDFDVNRRVQKLEEYFRKLKLFVWDVRLTDDEDCNWFLDFVSGYLSVFFCVFFGSPKTFNCCQRIRRFENSAKAAECP